MDNMEHLQLNSSKRENINWVDQATDCCFGKQVSRLRVNSDVLTQFIIHHKSLPSRGCAVQYCPCAVLCFSDFVLIAAQKQAVKR